MSILINKHTVALVQGVTGKEGGRAAKEMAAYGTHVAAGVTPGKGGMHTDDSVPVFNTVHEALSQFPNINATLIAVPAKFAPSAVREAIDAHIPLITILTEKIPIADAAVMVALAKENGVRIVGPSSVGIVSPGEGKIGSIGGSELVHSIFSPGCVGVISKSGGMTAELSKILTEAGIGQSTAIGIGGDLLIGSDFLDIAKLFEQDESTRAIVIFGEVGGTYEEQLADALNAREITKPVIALIAGKFSEALPIDTVLGHAGAIVNGTRGSAYSKISALRSAGATIAETPEDIVTLVKNIL